MGQTLKNAGVAVTITSLTDVFAFAVGSVTVNFNNNERKIYKKICNKHTELGLVTMQYFILVHITR
jgi:hypothetical protein